MVAIGEFGPISRYQAAFWAMEFEGSDFREFLVLVFRRMTKKVPETPAGPFGHNRNIVARAISMRPCPKGRDRRIGAIFCYGDAY